MKNLNSILLEGKILKKIDETTVIATNNNGVDEFKVVHSYSLKELDKGDDIRVVGSLIISNVRDLFEDVYIKADHIEPKPRRL